jgi:flavin-dependent dehydrogenase
LLRRAAQAGVQVRRGVRVTGLARRPGGWAVDTADGQALRTPALFLASGKRDLKGWKRPAGLQPDLIGFQLHLRLAPAAAAIAGAVELHLFPGGYAGLEPVDGGLANLCLVVRRTAYAELGGGQGGNWQALLAYVRAQCPGLDTRLASAAPQTARPAAIAAIPYGYVARPADGLWRLGDQAAVIPSFAGEGMSIALHSAHLAAAFALAGRPARDYQATLSRDLSAKVLGATLLSQAMVRPGLQRWIGAGLAAAPGLAGLVARHTRLRAA